MKRFTSIQLMLTIMLFTLTGCEHTSEVNYFSEELNTTNLIAVSSSNGENITLVDKNTFAVRKIVHLDVPTNIKVNQMCLSTNRDYFVFSFSSGEPFYKHFIGIYNIRKGEMGRIFPTGLDSIGAPNMISTNNKQKPFQIYFYSHLNGLYQIDFSTGEVINLNYDYSQSTGRNFYHVLDKGWLIINKSMMNHAEIEIYKGGISKSAEIFRLNSNNKDRIGYFTDLFYEDSSNRLYYIDMKDIGYYDLSTQLCTKIKLDFQNTYRNPYSIVASSSRNEIYLNYSEDSLYTLDSRNFKLKNTTAFPKNSFYGKMFLRKDEKVLFAPSSVSNQVVVYDLETKKIINTIYSEFAFKIEEL